MTTAALTVSLILLTALAAMQALLGLGLPLGNYAWGGRHRILPPRLRIASLAAIVIYGAFAALLLSRTGVLPGRETALVVVATWVLFAYSLLSIGGNIASRSRHERIVQIPASAVLSAAIFVVALGMPPG
jgi:hypothetical protein